MRCAGEGDYLVPSGEGGDKRHYVVITCHSLARLLAVVEKGPLKECCNNHNLVRRVFGTPSGRLRFARLTASECATDARKLNRSRFEILVVVFFSLPQQNQPPLPIFPSLY